MLGIIKLILSLLIEALPTFWDIKEKSHEAIEAESDPMLDAELDSYEWVS